MVGVAGKGIGMEVAVGIGVCVGVNVGVVVLVNVGVRRGELDDELNRCRQRTLLPSRIHRLHAHTVLAGFGKLHHFGPTAIRLHFGGGDNIATDENQHIDAGLAGSAQGRLPSDQLCIQNGKIKRRRRKGGERGAVEVTAATVTALFKAAAMVAAATVAATSAAATLGTVMATAMGVAAGRGGAVGAGSWQAAITRPVSISPAHMTPCARLSGCVRVAILVIPVSLLHWPTTTLCATGCLRR